MSQTLPRFHVEQSEGKYAIRDRMFPDAYACVMMFRHKRTADAISNDMNAEWLLELRDIPKGQA